MREPIDYVKSDERVPRGERRPESCLVCAYIFAVAGMMAGWGMCWLWMTVGG